YLRSVPLWLTGAVIGRDILVLIGLVVIQITIGKVTVRPRLLGKVATVLQMATVVWILLQWPERWLAALILAAAICTGLSGLLYVLDFVRQVGAHPASSPKPEVETRQPEI